MNAKETACYYRRFLVPQYYLSVSDYQFSFWHSNIMMWRNTIRYRSNWIIWETMHNLGPVRRSIVDRWQFVGAHRDNIISYKEFGKLKTCIFKAIKMFPRWMYKEWR